MNIRFEYLYRDAGNNKLWGDVVFANPEHLSIEELTGMAEAGLIDGLNFVAREVKVPELRFPDYDQELDHDWHEFHALELTSDAPADSEMRTIDEFLSSVRLACAPVRAALSTPNR